VLDAKLRGDFCELLDAGGQPLPLSECFAPNPHSGPDVLRGASDGTELPVVPDYKANLTGRYRFQMGSLDAFAQAAFVYQSESRAALTTFDEGVLGKNEAYGLADFSVGFGRDSWTAQVFLNNAFDKRADITRFAQCREEMCNKPYIVTNRPRTIGVKFGQKF
jgi:outer membrane receptor protein involved in Fe transport